MIRAYAEGDLAALAQIHRESGADYALPDMESPLLVNKVIYEDENGVVAAGLHKVCYETFLLVSPEANAQEKWRAIQAINGALVVRAYRQGLDEMHASVPPIGFDRRLRQLGWEPDREDWKLWSRRTHAVSSESGE